MPRIGEVLFECGFEGVDDGGLAPEGEGVVGVVEVDELGGWVGGEVDY